MNKIRKILIANRGEISVRIARTANELNIRTVAIYTMDDKDSLHLQKTDESVYLKGNTLKDTYLNVGAVIEAALNTGCDAIHPGYGFLSENDEFAQACVNNGLIFIGPSPGVIKLMGNKAAANEFVKSLGIPVLQNTKITSEKINRLNGNIRFPLLVKAATGGGGKGMRLVRSWPELSDAIETTSREALLWFDDPSVILEEFIACPRHIEVQVLGDHTGNYVHLFERECSLQRRYQKIIEEAPSVSISQELRDRIAQAALRIASAARYTNAGTIEFLIDKKMNFYFLEMNTRLQVEHPVTEMITGIDIVREQIRIAGGELLSLTQSDIKADGHAMEARIYAENPEAGFLPSQGKINYLKFPVSENVRVDTAISNGYEIKSQYDPLLAKVIVLASDRDESIKKMDQSLGQFIIHGVQHNGSFLRAIVNNTDFKMNRISTDFIESDAGRFQYGMVKSEEISTLLFAAASLVIVYKKNAFRNNSIWNMMGNWRIYHRIPLQLNEKSTYVGFFGISNSITELSVEKKIVSVSNVNINEDRISFSTNSGDYTFTFSERSNKIWLSFESGTFTIIRKDIPDPEKDYFRNEDGEPGSTQIKSPVPGKILKIQVKTDSVIQKGETVLIIDSMKIENKVLSPVSGKVSNIYVKEGDQVSMSHLMVEIGEA